MSLPYSTKPAILFIKLISVIKRSINHKIFYRLHLIASALQAKFRLYRLRQLGATIGKNNQIGKLQISFPSGIRIGDNCLIEDQVSMRLYLPFSGSRISIGDNNFIGHGTQININTPFKIGDDCLIAANCIFSDVQHIYTDLQKNINQQGCQYRPIEIQDNVWLGAGVKVLAGVTVHSGAIIAAGAVVNRDIPSNEIWGGVPARKIKDRIYSSTKIFTIHT